MLSKIMILFKMSFIKICMINYHLLLTSLLVCFFSLISANIITISFSFSIIANTFNSNSLLSHYLSVSENKQNDGLFNSMIKTNNPYHISHNIHLDNQTLMNNTDICYNSYNSMYNLYNNSEFDCVFPPAPPPLNHTR